MRNATKPLAALMILAISPSSLFASGQSNHVYPFDSAPTAENAPYGDQNVASAAPTTTAVAANDKDNEDKLEKARERWLIEYCARPYTTTEDDADLTQVIHDAYHKERSKSKDGQALFKDARDPVTGQTCLMVAAAQGNVDLMNVALNRQADINATDDEGWTALMWAVANDQLSAVKRLLGRCDIDMNIKAHDGHTTALSIARSYYNPGPGPHPELMEQAYTWIDFRQNMDFKCPSIEETLKWCATPEFAPEQGYIFIEPFYNGVKADDIKDQNGKTCSMIAAESGNNERLIQYMIENGGDINKQDNTGMTTLMYAVKNGRTSTVQFLLKDPQLKLDVQANNGQTASTMAFDLGKDDILSLIQRAKDSTNGSGAATGR